MGNSATKEQRQVPPRLRSASRRASSTTASGPESSSSIRPPGSQQQPPMYSSRSGRGSQPNLSSLLGLGHGNERERDTEALEARRESKQERDQRRLERDRANREKERARSMRDESVDGGYLVTQGVYTGLEDFNKYIVRQLMIERRLAPFWKGLNDHSESWTEHQLIAAARGLPIPAADAIPVEEPSSPFSPISPGHGDTDGSMGNLAAPTTSRAQSYNSDTSSNLSPAQSNFPLPSSALPTNTSSSGPAIFRGRSKTLASLTGSSKPTQGEMAPREMRLPKDPFVHGQPIEAYLYKDASECPICFLYYPPYLNKTRCCDQDICSECFVQIKRPDPHLPEHHEASSQNTGEPPDPDALTSEIATCPFCKQPDFGITFEPPPFRRGLTYVNQASNSAIGKVACAMSSSSSLASAMSGGKASSVDTARRRAQSLSANDPAVVTTDSVRPDWHQKLEGARAHAARRSAAATALHTAAYLMGNRGQESDSRGFSAFGRRALLRRGSGPASSSTRDETSQMNLLALMAERYGAQASNRTEGDQEGASSPRGSSRRVRIDDLEEMMMLEAIRMSLASEDERRRKEEDDSKESRKSAKKEARKKEKEVKRAEKAAKKSGIYSGSASQSSMDLRGESSEASGKGKAVQQPPEAIPSGSSATAPFSPLTPSSPFLPDPTTTDQEQAHLHLERARAQLQPEISPFASPFDSHPYRPSHLRNQSNASSTDDDDSVRASLRGGFRGSGSGSSFEVSPSGSGINITEAHPLSGTPPGGGAGLEPMFNFRSLAAMVGEDEKAESTKHVEHLEDSPTALEQSARSGPEDKETVPGQQSMRTVDEEAFHDALESPRLPDVNIIAPSRTGSDLMAQPPPPPPQSGGDFKIITGHHEGDAEGAAGVIS
ncbi:MAG: hypothetical protein Q9195_008000 [Heterodermia aff. obscurata]